MKNGYAICLNEWSLDKSIKNELGLLLIISSLCAEKGFCWASNKYLAELFEEPEQTISRKIKNLADKGYINITYVRRGAEILRRELRLTKLLTDNPRLTKMLTDDYQNCEPTINKNVKENNINNNITSNNIFTLFIYKIIKKKNEFDGKEADKVNQAYMWAREQPEFEQLSPSEQNIIKLEIYGK